MKKYDYPISVNHKRFIRYIQKMARNTKSAFIVHMKTKENYDSIGELPYYDAYLGDLVNTQAKPDEFEFMFSSDALFHAVEQMTKIEKYALYYKFIYGLKNWEIANIVGCSEKTVKRARKRAIEKLRHALRGVD